MAERPDESEKLRRENEKLKMERQRMKEKLSARDVENALLKEQLKSKDDELINERREKRLLQEQLLQAENVSGQCSSVTPLVHQRILIASVESKEFLLAKSQADVRRLERASQESKDEIEKCKEREGKAASRVKALEKICHQLVLRIDGLFSQLQGYEEEIRSLSAKIVDLEDEIKFLSATNAVLL